MTSAAPADPRDALTSHDPAPEVELPRDAVPMPLLVGIALVLGLALFLFLDANRRAMLGDIERPGTTATRLPAPPPPLIVPPAPPPVLPSPVVIREQVVVPASPAPQPPPARMARPPQPAGAATQPAPPPKLRGNEPALVADFTVGSGAGGAGAAGDAAAGDDAVRATLIRNRSSIIPQGAIIAAVLETPLNSDRPGLARAIVSQDARSFDGARVLIPRGSRLIGEFKADINPGMRRVLVTWSRLIRPDGVAIRIGSPVTDALGGAGAPGKVNTHFFERFASAILQSALTIGVNVASQIPTDNGTVIYGIPGQAAQVGQQLVPTVNRPPTVKVREGAQIAVFVARDLDFGGTPPVR